MKTVTAAKYIEGVNSIYEEKPQYKTGRDGSDGYCDCIGMCRGGLKRAGATGVSGMNGTNYAARYTIKDLFPINQKALRLGDVVLKTRSADDPNMPLPDRYRPGGANYTGDETNYTHIGTVTSLNPLKITHMTSPTAKIDSSIKGWAFMGRLPWVDAESPAPEPSPEPSPEPTPEPETATVYAENGKPVKMRYKPSSSCRLYWEVPCGSVVDVLARGEDWSQIQYNGRTGWMLNAFLVFDDLVSVIIPNITKSQADALILQFNGAHIL